MSNLRNRLDKIQHEVRKNLNSKQLAQKCSYDIKVREQVFHAGNLVYCEEKSAKKGEGKKLRRIWKGLYLVVQANHQFYTIKTKKRDLVLHHNNLKACDNQNIPLYIQKARNKSWEIEADLFSPGNLSEEKPHTSKCLRIATND